MNAFGPRLCLSVVMTLAVSPSLFAQGAAQSSSTSSSRSPAVTPKKVNQERREASADWGAVSNGVYTNRNLGFTCKIPAGWVLRTEEMNARDEAPAETEKDSHISQNQGDVGRPGEQQESRASPDRTTPSTALRAGSGSCPNVDCGRVLLAAFSRPPEARGEDVNASIVIAAESVKTYPGLTDAAQYLVGPVSEVAKAQGLALVEEPYEFAVGTKNLPRADFQKDVGTRVMRQSTLVLLARGYVVSVTFIGGTEDEVEELVEGLSVAVATKPSAE